MGIFCNVVVNPPFGGIFAPGCPVSGTIKYALNSKYTFKRVVISLKGIGRLTVKKTKGSGKNRRTVTYTHNEDYVHFETIVQDETNQKECDPGEYYSHFAFQLPFNVPSSLYYKKYHSKYKINCRIMYYVRIKFEMPGMLQMDKRFKKEIIVTSNVITPRLSMVPIMHGERKKLFQPFRRKDSIVNIKATILNSVLRPGETVQVTCEIINDTNVDIRCVKGKLIEAYSFYLKTSKSIEIIEKIIPTHLISDVVKKGETKHLPINFCLPNDLFSSEYSNIVARDYHVVVKVELPSPYLNVSLRVPIQVGYLPVVGCLPEMATVVPEGHLDYAGVPNDPPPTYWEAMNECKKGDLD